MCILFLCVCRLACIGSLSGKCECHINRLFIHYLLAYTIQKQSCYHETGSNVSLHKAAHRHTHTQTRTARTHTHTDTRTLSLLLNSHVRTHTRTHICFLTHTLTRTHAHTLSQTQTQTQWAAACVCVDGYLRCVCPQFDATARLVRSRPGPGPTWRGPRPMALLGEWPIVGLVALLSRWFTYL